MNDLEQNEMTPNGETAVKTDAAANEPAADPAAETETAELTPEEEQARIAEEYRKFGIADPSGERSIDEIADLLSTFDGTEERAAPKARAFNKRRAVVTGVIALCAVICLVVWFAVLRPTGEVAAEMIKVSDLLYPSTEEERVRGTAEAMLNHAYEDEVDAASGTDVNTGEGFGITVFRTVNTGELASVTVSNAHGSFAFENKEGTFVITGAEEYAYSKEMFAILQAVTCNPSIQMRVRTDCDDADYAEFGLSEKDNPAVVTVKTQSGVSHTLYVGSASPSEGGYYARYEGRPVVYLMNSQIGLAVFEDVRAYLSPLVTLPVGQNQYYMQDNFTIYKNGELFMRSRFLPQEERDAVTTTRVFAMTYPGLYSLSGDSYDDALLTLAALEGTAVLEYQITPEKLAAYGLDTPAYRLTYTYSDVDVTLDISEKREDGTYAVYSSVYDLITSVDGASLSFLEYDLIDFVERPIFSRNITDIRSIKIASDDVNAFFALTHYDSKDHPLDVTETVSGTEIEDITNFRNLYKDLLTVKIEESSRYTDETLPQNARKIASVEVRTVGVATIDFCFYSYPEKDLYYLYTFNGDGEFDVGKGTVMKLLNDTVKCIKGEAIDPNSRK